jgi:hypothetical protein
MPKAVDAKPECDVWLFKTINREALADGVSVSERYQMKDDFIILNDFLGDGSVIRTSKSTYQPAGGFSITFSDKSHDSWNSPGDIESLYGLIEPMDIVTIRMWGGIGPRPALLPIVMRGFVSEISRSRSVGEDGRPQRTVTVSGQDFGKLWQIHRVQPLAGYAGGKALLTTFQLFEMYGISAENTMSAGKFVREMIEKVVNPYMGGFMPETFGMMPREITVGDGVTVKHGVVHGNFQLSQGSVYQILCEHCDVGIWNELYLQDDEAGVNLIYRPIPALLLATPEGRASALIQEDATMPPACSIPDAHVKSIQESRSDADTANFFWVDSPKFELIDDITRKVNALRGNQPSFDYQNCDQKLYGVRMMEASTQQGETSIKNMSSGLPQDQHEARSLKQLSWLEDRRRIMTEMCKDNVIYETGSAVVKGGPTRPGSTDLMKAGDYAEFSFGQTKHRAYVQQIDHDFMPFRSFTTTLHFVRGDGFAKRAAMSGSPWLAEQASRNNNGKE